MRPCKQTAVVSRLLMNGRLSVVAVWKQILLGSEMRNGMKSSSWSWEMEMKMETDGGSLSIVALSGVH